MEIWGVLIPIMFLSALAWWRFNSIAFMLAGGLAIMTGLYAPDVISSASYTSPFDITIALTMICYGLCCWGFAFACMFWDKEGYH